LLEDRELGGPDSGSARTSERPAAVAATLKARTSEIGREFGQAFLDYETFRGFSTDRKSPLGKKPREELSNAKPRRSRKVGKGEAFHAA
jgi:hypothetical protein